MRNRPGFLVYGLLGAFGIACGSDGEVWDSEGRLVAQSRQLGLTPL